MAALRRNFEKMFLRNSLTDLQFGPITVRDQIRHRRLFRDELVKLLYGGSVALGANIGNGLIEERLELECSHRLAPARIFQISFAFEIVRKHFMSICNQRKDLMAKLDEVFGRLG